MHYWRTPSGTEVDFVWTRAQCAVGLEVKAATTWRNEYGAPLKTRLSEGQLTAGFGIYTGITDLKDGLIHVWPLKGFLQELTNGHVLV